MSTSNTLSFFSFLYFLFSAMDIDVRVPEAANVVAVVVAVVNVAEAAAEVGTEIVVVVVAEIGIETEIGIAAVGIVAETETETVIETVRQPTVVGNGSCCYEDCGSRRGEGREIA